MVNLFLRLALKINERDYLYAFKQNKKFSSFQNRKSTGEPVKFKKLYLKDYFFMEMLIFQKYLVFYYYFY